MSGEKRVEWRKPLLVAIAIMSVTLGYMSALKVYLALPNQSDPRYFAQLAWSFWQGRVDLIDAPPYSLDLCRFGDRMYAYWPPLSAFLMMPFVKFTGPEMFPQRLFAMVIGTINTGLFYLAIERLSQSDALEHISLSMKVILALALGLGTSNLIFALWASVWHIGQITATTFVLIGLIFGLERRPERRQYAAIASFVFLAIATMGRLNLILTTPFWIYLAISDEQYGIAATDGYLKTFYAYCKRRRGLINIVGWMTPLLVVLVLLLVYNYLRFGDVFQMGMAVSNQPERLVENLNRHGVFSFYYLPRNIYYTLVRPPFMYLLDGEEFGMGFSLFLQSPFLLLLFCRPVGDIPIGLRNYNLLAIGLVSMNILMFSNTGWGQFGARYLFDVMPFVGLLLAFQIGKKRMRLLWLLSVLSIAINTFGVFGHAGKITWLK